MELYIAGGVGEHGRNCFFLQNGGDAILVDCGLMAGSDDPLPRLTESQIRKLKAVVMPTIQEHCRGCFGRGIQDQSFPQHPHCSSYRLLYKMQWRWSR